MASFNIVEENHDFLLSLVRDYVDLLFANEEEARVFTGHEPEEAIHHLGGMCEIAVLKIGAKGSMIASGGQVHRVSAVPARVIDTTGAGDLYATGFLYGLSRELPLPRCGEIGSLIAAKAIETIGPTVTEEALLQIQAALASFR
ncbi:MAG: PfkB family carbohydrate kinase [Rikenellaceae bacterium]|nr:PfkB family carbohydrate kinase [Rikenellaceae bacterium]